jgi:hypothetical protein
VEPHLYFIELGKCAAQDAIRLDRKGKQGTELLARLEECAKLATKLVEESRR